MSYFKRFPIALIEIHNSGNPMYVIATGGGTSFLGEFLKIPGGSSVVIGGEIPYSTALVDQLLGAKPDNYASGECARKLAVVAYEKARKATQNELRCMGIGAACSLYKNNEREGRIHKFCVAIHKKYYTAECIITAKTINPAYLGVDVREEQELFVSRVMFTMIWNARNVNYFTTPKESIKEINSTLLDSNFEIININWNVVHDTDVNLQDVSEIKTNVIYPGSFNPLHEAHDKIYNKAKEIIGVPIQLELSITNSYKPKMDWIELKNRLDPIRNKYNVLVTNAPRFVDKVNFLKENGISRQIVFVVGADTWNRVFDKTAIKNGDIEFFLKNNVKFLVFGRKQEIVNMGHPLMIVNEEALNFDFAMSSTEIRKASK